MMLEGIEVKPSEMEDFEDHMLKHQLQYEEIMASGDGKDAQAISLLEIHRFETEQMQQKVMMQQEAMAKIAAASMMLQGQGDQQQNNQKGKANGNPSAAGPTAGFQ